MKFGQFFTSFCTVLALFFLGCAGKKSEIFSGKSSITLCNSVVLPETRDSTITIFIHGTRVFPKFHAQELFYSPEGLKNFAELEKASHMRTIAKALEAADPQRFNTQAFYTFGWNGNLNFQERKKAAQDLYRALKNFSENYQSKEGKRPKLRIITHSHGGNVALNLAHIAQEMNDNQFYIDELILLACPVQQETKNCAADQIFGRIYSVSSQADFLQIIDPQGLYPKHEEAPLFSERFFAPQARLLQGQVKLHGRPLWHIEFLMKKCFDHLPCIMDELDKYYRPLCEKTVALAHIPTIIIHDASCKNYGKQNVA